MMRTTPIILFLLCTVLSACDKNQNRSNKLMKGQIWTVDELSIDGQEQTINGQWTIIEDVDIYEAVPSALWNANGQVKQFYWQFREKGKKIELSADSCGGSFQDIDFLAYNDSGVYEVEKQSRKEMIFSSSNVLGFTGGIVRIKIRRL